MLYKFIYLDYDGVWKKELYLKEKQALNLFNILITSRVPFRVETITKIPSR